MKNKIKKYLKEIVVFIVVLTIVANAISYYRSLDLNKEKLNLNKVTLLDNKIYEIPKNKPVLIHFWATWCPTCKLEASNIEKISKDYEVITVAVQSGSKKQIQDYLEENELTFKVINDENSYYMKKFNIKAFPTTLIYNSNGELKFSEVGYTSTWGLYLRLLLTK